jgi:hypothetical protein
MSIPPTRNTYSEIVQSSTQSSSPTVVPNQHNNINSIVNDQQNRRNHHNNITMIMSRTPRFEGKCEDLKGHIYDCANIRQGNQYSRTTKEISKYVGRTFKFGMDTKLSIEKLQISMPCDPPLESNCTNIRIWENQNDDYAKRETSLKENIKTTDSPIWGQCSDAMRQKVESVEVFMSISEDRDAIELLKVLKDAVFNFWTQEYTPQAIHEAKR